MERELFKDVLSRIVCTFVNKVHDLKIWSSKTHIMNFELGGHIVQKAETKKESDLAHNLKGKTKEEGK